MNYYFVVEVISIYVCYIINWSMNMVVSSRREMEWCDEEFFLLGLIGI